MRRLESSTVEVDVEESAIRFVRGAMGPYFWRQFSFLLMTESPSPSCPRCRSLDTKHRDLIHKEQMNIICVCLDCGHVWQRPVPLIAPSSSSS